MNNVRDNHLETATISNLTSEYFNEYLLFMVSFYGFFFFMEELKSTLFYQTVIAIIFSLFYFDGILTFLCLKVQCKGSKCRNSITSGTMTTGANPNSWTMKNTII